MAVFWGFRREEIHKRLLSIRGSITLKQRAFLCMVDEYKRTGVTMREGSSAWLFSMLPLDCVSTVKSVPSVSGESDNYSTHFSYVTESSPWIRRWWVDQEVCLLFDEKLAQPVRTRVSV